jgi:hypothetical protein
MKRTRSIKEVQTFLEEKLAGREGASPSVVAQ